MPIHEVGYRGWHGKRKSSLFRWTIITRTGIRLALKSRWVARLLFLAWLPVAYWGIGFFVIENTLESKSTGLGAFVSDITSDVTGIDSSEARGRAVGKIVRKQFRGLPQRELLADALESGDVVETRHTIWSWLLMTFFRYPQGMLILFLVGSIAPSLIAQDLRSRAFLLYFSRPIGRLEYLIGKLLVPMVFMTMVTMVPAIALYFFAIMMSPDLSALYATWDLPLRIGLATLTLVVPVSVLSVMLSSLTQESRFANFSWFAVWALGHGAWMTILFSVAAAKRKTPFDLEVVEHPVSERWSVLSIYNNLGDVQAYIFGFESFQDIWISAAALVVMTVVSLIILYNRISAPIRL